MRYGIVVEKAIRRGWALAGTEKIATRAAGYPSLRLADLAETNRESQSEGRDKGDAVVTIPAR
jgi:hypothetical protein